MRWVTFADSQDGTDRPGLVVDAGIHTLERGVSLLSLLGDDGERLATAGERARRDPVDVIARDSVHLRAPMPQPPSLRDFYAFEQHVRTARQRRGLDMEPDWYELPVFYFSSPHAITGPEEWRLWGVTSCGKGDPMQLMQVGHGASPARFRGVEVGHS